MQEIDCIPVFNAPMGNVATTVPEVQYRISDDIIRENFRIDAAWGDSGHPNFLVAGDSLIFLFPTHNTPLGNLHFGMSCLSICLKDEIEIMMNNLCEENGVTNRYSIREFDFQELENR